MTYALSARSLGFLAGPPAVHPKLVAVVKEAILHTTQDFTFTERQVRTMAEQAEKVRQGVSKTLQSNHLVHSDGYGHAVDVVPFVNGKASWDWQHIWAVAEAMERAADAHQVELIWGGVWDKRMGTYGSSAADFKRECDAYVARRKAKGLKAFIDGPHFELV